MFQWLVAKDLTATTNMASSPVVWARACVWHAIAGRAVQAEPAALLAVSAKVTNALRTKQTGAAELRGAYAMALVWRAVLLRDTGENPVETVTQAIQAWAALKYAGWCVLTSRSGSGVESWPEAGQTLAVLAG